MSLRAHQTPPERYQLRPATNGRGYVVVDTAHSLKVVAYFSDPSDWPFDPSVPTDADDEA